MKQIQKIIRNIVPIRMSSIDKSEKLRQNTDYLFCQRQRLVDPTPINFKSRGGAGFYTQN